MYVSVSAGTFISPSFAPLGVISYRSALRVSLHTFACVINCIYIVGIPFVIKSCIVLLFSPLVPFVPLESQEQLTSDLCDR